MTRIPGPKALSCILYSFSSGFNNFIRLSKRFRPNRYHLTNKVYREEIIAKELYQQLLDKLQVRQNAVSKIAGWFKKDKPNAITVSIEGAGVHWKCIVTRGTRKCVIHCFSYGTDAQSKKGGPDYFTYFYSTNPHVPTGRTIDKEKTIEAVKSWCENATVESLYAQFEFIDFEKRVLERIKGELFNFYPELLQATQKEIIGEDFNSYCLWFKHNERACRIYYYAHKAMSGFHFEWDDTTVFEPFSNDIARMGSLIKQWVIDSEQPSVLSNIYTEVDFGKLAPYYEQGKGVEGEFVMSWDKIEEFYKNIDLEKRDDIFKLIATIREKGFDKTLRAGQSLYTMILSRSRRYGLENDKAYLRFSFVYIKSAMQVSTWKGEVFQFDSIEYNDTIENLLKSLEQEAVS